MKMIFLARFFSPERAQGRHTCDATRPCVIVAFPPINGANVVQLAVASSVHCSCSAGGPVMPVFVPFRTPRCTSVKRLRLSIVVIQSVSRGDPIHAIVISLIISERKIGDGKFLIVGHGVGGRVVEVIIVRDRDETIYVIHSQQISKRRRRRR